MFHATLVFIHIAAAFIAIFAGLLAMIVRKRSGWHGAAGTVFVVAMLTMSSTAAYLATFLKPNRINAVAGLLTFYLVATAWRAAKNRTGRASWIDTTALVFALGVAIAAFAVRVVPVGVFALLFAIGDVRMLARGGVFGSERIARHLWRMGVALLIALLSFYPGQARNFGSVVNTPLIFIPHIFVFVSMLVSLRGAKKARNPGGERDGSRHPDSSQRLGMTKREGVAWTA